MKKILILLVGMMIVGVGCFAQTIDLMGAGATFPQPLYSRMFDDYSNSQVRVNYQGIGSGGGINQLIAKTTDFGGTDAIVAADVEEKSGETILHVPTCLGAVVVTYNLKLENNVRLKFTGDLIADIFMGNVKDWSDKKIADLNPGVKLPKLPITVVSRSDGSGTSFIFTDYLSKVNKTWADKVGCGTAVQWPVGIGAKGNPGVAETIQGMEGAIGYVELIYALSNNIPYGDVRNKSGNFITPTMETVSYSANVEIPANAKVSLVDTAHAQGYPISSFTWIILFKEQAYEKRNIDKAKATVKMIEWMITDGQKFAADLHYAPLPEAAQKVGKDILKSVTFNGRPLF